MWVPRCMIFASPPGAKPSRCPCPDADIDDTARIWVIIPVINGGECKKAPAEMATSYLNPRSGYHFWWCSSSGLVVTLTGYGPYAPAYISPPPSPWISPRSSSRSTSSKTTATTRIGFPTSRPSSRPTTSSAVAKPLATTRTTM